MTRPPSEWAPKLADLAAKGYIDKRDLARDYAACRASFNALAQTLHGSLAA